MKSFFKENSYLIVKLFLTQIVMAMFGLMLSFASVKSTTFKLAAGILAAGFYLFMVYHFVWEIGTKDKLRIESGRLKLQPLKGFWMTLIANIPNLLLALAMGVGTGLEKIFHLDIGYTVSGLCYIIANLINGMYRSLVSWLSCIVFGTTEPGGTASNALPSDIWWWFLLLILPALFIGWLAYIRGTKDKHFFKINPSRSEKKQ